MMGESAKAFLLACCAVLALSGCATTAATNPRDPYEGFNRAMFEVNEAVDTVVAKPLAKGYERAVPLPVKASVGNFFANLADLFIGVNNGLQGKVGDGASDFGRLLINSTVGLFGLFDVASELGLDKHDEDFGQTLAVWGVGDGGFVFLPILGPRTVRDTAGWIVDSRVDPIRRIPRVAVRNSAAGLRFVDVRASLLPADKLVDEAALDRYTYIRDAYLQRRLAQRYDGRPPKTQD